MEGLPDPDGHAVDPDAWKTQQQQEFRADITNLVGGKVWDAAVARAQEAVAAGEETKLINTAQICNQLKDDVAKDVFRKVKERYKEYVATPKRYDRPSFVPSGFGLTKPGFAELRPLQHRAVLALVLLCGEVEDVAKARCPESKSVVVS